MSVLYRKRQKHRTRFAARKLTRLAWMKSSNSVNSQVNPLPLARLALKRTTRTALVEQQIALRIRKGRRTTGIRKETSVAGMLRNVDSVTASNPIVLRRITVQDGTIYPLRTEITVVVKHVVKTAEAFIHELKWLTSLFGKGNSDELAMGAFCESFHQLVLSHHRKPPHLLTTDDQKINRVIDHLVDWSRFEIENPIEQPFWGRIISRDEKGNIRIVWESGPNGEIKRESTVLVGDSVEAFASIRDGNWFYGAGRVFPDRTTWTALPVEIPDPYDAVAISDAWDLIPRHLMSNLNAWPLSSRG